MKDTEKKINYKIIKSNKYKRVRLSIKRNQEIIVSSPKNISNKAIEKFVCENKNWLDQNIAKLENDPKTKKHNYIDGDVFLFNGTLYNLKVIETDDLSYKKIKTVVNNIVLDQNNLLLQIKVNNLTTEEKELVISEFYKNKTKEIISQKFEINETFKEFKPLIKNIKIQKANGRWGSCSKVNNINFSSRLAMLPSECIDYIIYHELTHILEKNHGKNFYLKLEKLCPNYRDLELKIKNIERKFNVSLA